MADSDKTLELLIKLGVIGQEDAKAAKQLLDDYAPATDKAAEATNKLTIEHRSLHGILHLIAREAGPAAGSAVAAATALMTGGMFAAIIAVRELFNWFEALQKKAEEFREQQAAMWVAVQQGADDATQSARSYAEKIAEAETQGDGLKRKYEDQNKLLQDQIKAHKDLLEAIEKEALAAAGGDKDKEKAIREHFARLKLAGSISGEQALLTSEGEEVAALTREKAGAERAGGQAQLTLSQLIAQRDPLAQALKAITDKFGGEDKLKAAADRARQLKEDAASYGDSPSFVQGPNGGMVVTPAGAARFSARNADTDIKRFSDFQAASAAVGTNKTAIEQLEAFTGKATSVVGADTSSIADLHAAIKENTVALQELNRESLLGTKADTAGNTLGQLMSSAGLATGQMENILDRILGGQLNWFGVVANLEQKIRDHEQRLQALAMNK